MNKLAMKKFGSILTGREFGSDTWKKISKELKGDISLDFSGVISLGSSFADEVIVPIAKQQGGRVKILNASVPVKACINEAASDGGIIVIYDSTSHGKEDKK